MKYYRVVGAIVVHDGKILCVQKGKTAYDFLDYKYEFPGGKVEEGEDDESALIRELWEELSLEIILQSKIAVIYHQYPGFTVTLSCYLCTCTSNEFTLNEHINGLWMSKKDLLSLDWVAADQPVVRLLNNSSHMI